MLVDTVLATPLALGPGDIAAARQRAETDIRTRMMAYRMPPLSRSAPGRAVVLVDEGIATGLTMRAAVAYARRHGAQQVAVAIPCASAAAVRRLRPEVDRLVALVVDPLFSAVGDYYDDFRPLGDDEVAEMLARAAEHVRSPSA
jgi:putative phosphoribosyl transferase